MSDNNEDISQDPHQIKYISELIDAGEISATSIKLVGVRSGIKVFSIPTVAAIISLLIEFLIFMVL